MHQEQLLKPTVNELSEREQQIIFAAKEIVDSDDWYQSSAFPPHIEASLIGFYLDRSEQRAIPVYKTEHGCFTVDRNPEDRWVTSSRVREADVFTI